MEEIEMANIKELQEMMKSSDYKVRARAAQSELATPEMLLELSKDPKRTVRKEVAKKSNTPFEALIEIIAVDGCCTMKWNIQRIQELGVEDLRLILKDGREICKGFVANHPNTTSSLLEELSRDSNYFVKWDVAKHTNTSTETLSRLAEEEGFDVRKAVAKNPNTSVETLKKLATDKVGWVVEEVLKNPNKTQEIQDIIENRYLVYHMAGIW